MIGSFNPETDLLSLHYDHAADRDDGHATVAGKVIVDTYGINHVVVGGAHGKNGKSYVPDSELVMDATWGADGWINANADRQGAIQELGQKWLTTILNGGQVFVAEGGQSDTSLGAAKYVLENGGNPSKITIVQHSQWNLNNYGNGVLNALIDLGVNHTKIDDGNIPNKTADLNTTNFSSVSNFVSLALASPWAGAWQAAFDYYDPKVRLDFSDTVEALHILGVKLDEVENVTDFADRYFGSDASVGVELFLVETGGGNTVGKIIEGGTFDLAEIGNSLSIIAEPVDAVSRVDFNLSGQTALYNVDNFAPYTLAGDSNGKYVDAGLVPGDYSLFVLTIDPVGLIDESFTTNFTLIDSSIDPPVQDSDPIALSLINADSDLIIGQITNGAIIDLAEVGPSLSIVAELSELHRKVNFNLTGPVNINHTELFSPYSLNGDWFEDYKDAGLVEGDYTLTITPYSLDGKTSDPVTTNFSVIDSRDYLNDPQGSSPIQVGLYDAISNNLIDLIEDGDTIETGGLLPQNLTIAAFLPEGSSLADKVQSIALNLNEGQVTRIENVEPYALFGDDTHSNFFAGSGITKEANRIEFELYDQDKAKGILLDTLSIDFTLI